MKIELTMLQRLNLDALLAVQRGNMDQLYIPHEIRQKLRIGRELRSQYVKVLPNGNALMDEAAVQLAEPMTVDLEKEEVRRLSKLLREWDGFGEGDVEWCAALRRQLESPAAGRGVAIVKDEDPGE